MSHVRQVKLGRESCERIAKKLEEFGAVVLAEKKANGAYGKPDIMFKIGSYSYGIEAKRCKGVAFKKGVGNVSITFTQWEGLLRWCEKFCAKAIIIVEIIVLGGENLYFVVEGETVNKKFEKARGKARFGFSMWQVIREGHKLDDYFWGLEFSA